MPAGFARRLAAFLYDYAGIVLYLGLLTLISLFVYPDVQKLFSRSPVWSQLSGFLLVTLPVCLYYIISDSRLAGQSFGKKSSASASSALPECPCPSPAPLSGPS
ncbi:RDD family protein [Paenibacillus sp. CC-CFT747]|nr:RDD family protein [Paenibacillus sp. CC-CFT747]